MGFGEAGALQGQRRSSISIDLVRRLSSGPLGALLRGARHPDHLRLCLQRQQSRRRQPGPPPAVLRWATVMSQRM
jgi:hypothetical protein